MTIATSKPLAALRVLSLLPSATELVCQVGGEDNLVGISHECDWPASIRGLPRVTASKVDLSPSSWRIDQDVRALLTHLLAVYDLDTEALRRLRPDLIVTQDLCDVCAVSYADVERACRELLPDARIVNLHPTCWSEVLDDLQAVATAMGVPERGQIEVAALEARRRAIAERSARLGSRPKVLTIEWLAPVMIGGTWMPELVEAAGGAALVTRTGQHAPTLSREQLLALEPAPEVLLIKPCGFELERSASERELIAELLQGLDWPAIESGRVWIADGNAFFNRPGPRLLESIEILAACIHPEEFADFAERHRESFFNWRELDSLLPIRRGADQGTAPTSHLS